MTSTARASLRPGALLVAAIMSGCGHTAAYNSYLHDHDDCVRFTKTDAEYLACEHWALERLDAKGPKPASSVVVVGVKP